MSSPSNQTPQRAKSTVLSPNSASPPMSGGKKKMSAKSKSDLLMVSKKAKMAVKERKLAEEQLKQKRKENATKVFDQELRKSMSMLLTSPNAQQKVRTTPTQDAPPQQQQQTSSFDRSDSLNSPVLSNSSILQESGGGGGGGGSAPRVSSPLELQRQDSITAAVGNTSMVLASNASFTSDGLRSPTQNPFQGRGNVNELLASVQEAAKDKFVRQMFLQGDGETNMEDDDGPSEEQFTVAAIQAIETKRRQRITHMGLVRPQIWFESRMLPIMRQSQLRWWAMEKKRHYLNAGEPIYREIITYDERYHRLSLELTFEEAVEREFLQVQEQMLISDACRRFDRLLSGLIVSSAATEKSVDDVVSSAMIEEYGEEALKKVGSGGNKKHMMKEGAPHEATKASSVRRKRPGLQSLYRDSQEVVRAMNESLEIAEAIKKAKDAEEKRRRRQSSPTNTQQQPQLDGSFQALNLQHHHHQRSFTGAISFTVDDAFIRKNTITFILLHKQYGSALLIRSAEYLTFYFSFLVAIQAREEKQRMAIAFEEMLERTAALEHHLGFLYLLYGMERHDVLHYRNRIAFALTIEEERKQKEKEDEKSARQQQVYETEQSVRTPTKLPPLNTPEKQLLVSNTTNSHNNTYARSKHDDRDNVNSLLYPTSRLKSMMPSPLLGSPLVRLEKEKPSMLSSSPSHPAVQPASSASITPTKKQSSVSMISVNHGDQKQEDPKGPTSPSWNEDLRRAAAISKRNRARLENALPPMASSSPDHSQQKISPPTAADAEPSSSPQDATPHSSQPPVLSVDEQLAHQRRLDYECQQQASMNALDLQSESAKGVLNAFVLVNAVMQDNHGSLTPGQAPQVTNTGGRDRVLPPIVGGNKSSTAPPPPPAQQPDLFGGIGKLLLGGPNRHQPHSSSKSQPSPMAATGKNTREKKKALPTRATLLPPIGASSDTAATAASPDPDGPAACDADNDTDLDEANDVREDDEERFKMQQQLRMNRIAIDTSVALLLIMHRESADAIADEEAYGRKNLDKLQRKEKRQRTAAMEGRALSRDKVLQRVYFLEVEHKQRNTIELDEQLSSTLLTENCLRSMLYSHETKRFQNILLRCKKEYRQRHQAWVERLPRSGSRAMLEETVNLSYGLLDWHAAFLSCEMELEYLYSCILVPLEKVQRRRIMTLFQKEQRMVETLRQERRKQFLRTAAIDTSSPTWQLFFSQESSTRQRFETFLLKRLNMIGEESLTEPVNRALITLEQDRAWEDLSVFFDKQLALLHQVFVMEPRVRADLEAACNGDMLFTLSAIQCAPAEGTGGSRGSPRDDAPTRTTTWLELYVEDTKAKVIEVHERKARHRLEVLITKELRQRQRRQQQLLKR